MMYLTWRQFRLQAFVALLALALTAVLVVLTGSQLAHVYDTDVAPCLLQAQGNAGSCGFTVNSFINSDPLLQNLLRDALLAVPALLGIFWGAPLVAHELESGTFRLVWTQSVTKRHWLAIKLGAIGLASAVVTGLLSLMVTWWFSPIDRVNAKVIYWQGPINLNLDRFDPAVFDMRGIVPIGYVLFAFALGVTVGLLLSRILPAMAITLPLFVGAQIRRELDPTAPDGASSPEPGIRMGPGRWHCTGKRRLRILRHSADPQPVERLGLLQRVGRPERARSNEPVPSTRVSGAHR